MDQRFSLRGVGLQACTHRIKATCNDQKNSDDDGDDRDEDYDDSKQNNHESDYDSKRKRMMITRNRVCDDYRDDDDDDPIALITRFAAVWIRVCLLEVQWFLVYGRRPTSFHLYKIFLLRGVGLQARAQRTL